MEIGFISLTNSHIFDQIGNLVQLSDRLSPLKNEREYFFLSFFLSLHWPLMVNILVLDVGHFSFFLLRLTGALTVGFMPSLTMRKKQETKENWISSSIVTRNFIFLAELYMTPTRCFKKKERKLRQLSVARCKHQWSRLFMMENSGWHALLF